MGDATAVVAGFWSAGRCSPSAPVTAGEESRRGHCGPKSPIGGGSAATSVRSSAMAFEVVARAGIVAGFWTTGKGLDLAGFVGLADRLTTVRAGDAVAASGRVGQRGPGSHTVASRVGSEGSRGHSAACATHPEASRTTTVVPRRRPLLFTRLSLARSIRTMRGESLSMRFPFLPPGKKPAADAARG
ncbi:hypothetical protein [Rhodovulum sp. PH10]|uniref:hypothetical protein n=1 Tax=Rhodovulum sp. PH10 TaxID=1187851 RepID=UPI0012FB9DD1|nr:hypothetical protein [Rhodovulum sp. PH10]